MNELAAIEAVYSELASDLNRAKEEALIVNDRFRATRIERKQRINDSAYFILVWGQLEAEINRVAEAAVRTRRASVRWEERRAWDAHDPDNMRAKFEDRAALVLDRANATSDAYRRAIRYYGWRNAIAHGTNLATGIDVASTILDLYTIASENQAVGFESIRWPVLGLLPSGEAPMTTRRTSSGDGGATTGYAMASAGGDGDGAGQRPHPPAAGPRPDRRAEALRANLKRRKAQTRARDEVQGDAPRPEALGRNG